MITIIIFNIHRFHSYEIWKNSDVGSFNPTNILQIGRTILKGSKKMESILLSEQVLYPQKKCRILK